MVDTNAVIHVLDTLTNDIRELDLGTAIPRFPTLSPLVFLRDFVATNKPVVLTDAISHWPALERWKSEAYLIEKTNDTEVTVAFTPNGRADCPCPTKREPAQWCFALPYQQKLPLSTFFNLLRASQSRDQWLQDPHLVPYLQFQNSSLIEETPSLLSDVDAHLPWATEVFASTLPEAVNIWIGSSNSITAYHRDHYENIYCIVKGQKTFKLLPPVDAWKMALKRYPLAEWQRRDDGMQSNCLLPPTILELKLKEPRQEVLWSSILPCPLSAENQIDQVTKSQKIEKLKPFIVTVHAGETLYLPAGWWHEVHQGDGASIDDDDKKHEKEGDDVTIAVNYWYDMKYDVKYAMVNAVEGIAEVVGLNQRAPMGGGGADL